MIRDVACFPKHQLKGSGNTTTSTTNTEDILIHRRSLLTAVEQVGFKDLLKA